MPQEPRPKLRPVARPTDPFETPGVEQPGPALGGVNFGALGQLSETINRFNQNREQEKLREEREGRRVAREVEEENTAKVELTPHDRLLNIGGIADFDTPEGREALKGFKNSDHPLTIAHIQKAAALKMVQSSGVIEAFDDQQMLADSAALLTEGDEAGAQKIFEGIREKALKTMGDLSNPLVRETVLYKMSMLERKAETIREGLKDKISEQRQDEHMALAVNESLQGSFDSYVSGEGYDAEKSLAAAVNSIRENIKSNPLKKDTIIDSAFKQVEALHMDRASDPAMLHSFDSHRRALAVAFPSMEQSGKLGALERKLNLEEARQAEINKRDIPDLRYKLSSQLNSMLAAEKAAGRLKTEGEVRDFIYSSPQVLELITETAGTKVDPDILLGTVRESAMTRWAKHGTKESDPKVMASLMTQIYRGDPKIAGAGIESALANGNITAEAAGNLYSRRAAEEQRASSGSEAKRERDVAWRRVLKTFENLPATSIDKLPALQQTFTNAYRAWRDENPDADPFAGESSGLEALRATAEFQQIEEEQRSLGGAQLVNSSQFRDVLDQAKFLMSENEKARGGVANPTRDLKVLNEIKREFAGDIYTQLANSPEVLEKKTHLERISLIKAKMEDMVPDLLKRVRGIESGTKRTLRTAKLNNQDQLNAFELKGVVSPKYIKGITPVGVSDNVGTMWDGAQTNASSWLQTYLTQLHGADQEPMPQGGLAATNNLVSIAQEAAESTIVAMSYVALNGVPLGAQDAKRDGHKLSDMASLVKSTPDALKMLQAAYLVNGLTPQEVINGETRLGVPLQDIFGTSTVPWIQSINIQSTPLYVTVRDVDTAEAELAGDAPEQTRTGKMLISLGLDPTEASTRKKFFGWQRDLAERRNFKGTALRRANSNYQSFTTFRKGDPKRFNDLRSKAK